MRKLCLAIVLSLAVPSIGLAAPLCVAGTLDDYVALGPTGCMLGAATVADFTAAVLLPSAEGIPSNSVVVTPTPGIGLEFGVTQSAAAGELFDLLIGFTLSGPALGSAFLSMAGSAATGDGNVTAIQDLCVGGDFAGADPGTPCAGAIETLIVAQDAIGLVSPDTREFAPATFFDVFVDITVDGGLAGTSALDGSITTVFQPSVPEPAAIVLLSAGLAGLYCRRTRTHA
jgi:hypothetical protein